MAQAVEEHRGLHGAERHTLKPLGQGVARRVHQGGVEGPADLQGQAALGARLLGSGGSGIHSGLLAADDQLAGAVVVADLDHAQGGGLVAAGLEGLTIQGNNGGHPALDPLGGLGHGLAPEGGELNGGLGVQNTGGVQGRILAQGQARDIVGADALFFQHRSHAGGKSHHAGLGILGLVQNPVGVLKANLVQVKIQLPRVKGGAESGVGLVEILTHAGVLAALASVQNRKFHCVIPRLSGRGRRAARPVSRRSAPGPTSSG